MSAKPTNLIGNRGLLKTRRGSHVLCSEVAGAAAVATEEPLGADQNSIHSVRQLRKYKVLVASIVALVTGLVIVAASHKTPTVVLGRPDDTGDITYTVTEESGVRGLLREAGSALVVVGIIGLIFELFIRREGETEQRVLASEEGRRTADVIARRVMNAVLGEPAFVRELLNDEHRQQYLEMFIRADLDEDAIPLARRASSQFAGGVVLHDFHATYTAAVGASTDKHAELEFRLTRDKAPNNEFQIRFHVLEPDEEEDALTEDNPDVLVWRYRLDKGEKVEEVIEQFGVKSIRVNETNIDTTPEPTVSQEGKVKEYIFSASIPRSDKYKVTQTLRLPSPRRGSHVYLEPRFLTKAVEFICDRSGTNYDVVTIETLRADNVEQRTLSNGTVNLVQTPEWVLPSASVAFVFYDPPRPLSTDATSRTGNT